MIKYGESCLYGANSVVEVDCQFMNIDSVTKKHQANQAIAPAFLRSLYEESQSPSPTTVSQSPPEDEALMLALSGSKEWGVVKKYIELKVQRLLDATRQSARAGMDPAETGLRFFIFDQLQAFGEDIIKYVEFPAKARAAQNIINSNDTQPNASST